MTEEIKPPILTKSERRASSTGKTDERREFNKESEKSYKSNKFWDTCEFNKKKTSNT